MSGLDRRDNVFGEDPGKPTAKKRANETEDKHIQRRRDELRDLKIVLNTVEGRSVVWRLLDLSNMFRHTFTGDEWTGFYSGMAELGKLFYTDTMAINPDLFVQMAKEAKKKQLDDNTKGI